MHFCTLRAGPCAVELFGPSGTPSIGIIGCGFGGIGLGARLKLAGIHSFTIFDKNEGVGGTWYENRYPGAEVDSESPVYSFGFKTHDWSRNYAGQAELLAYLEETVDEYELRPHIRLGTQVVSVDWDDAEHVHTVTTQTGEAFRFHVVVCAVGLLNNTSIPDWPGLESFKGPRFHTARWEPEHDLAGKRIAVVGTGSSAAQVVPALQPIAGRLDLYQREPGHVLPKNARTLEPAERRWNRFALVRRLKRLSAYWRGRQGRGSTVPIVGSRLNRKFEAEALAHIERVFKDRPDLRVKLTPRYPFMGKRPVISDDFYPALLGSNVEVLPHAVARVTPTGLVDSTGTERPADVLVMATGFQPANYLANMQVSGTGGRSLHEFWADEPRAILGTAVAGFPNFYMLYGPNSNGGEIIFFENAQMHYILANLKRMVRRGVSSIDVRRRAMDRYNAWLQRRLARASFGRSAASASGKKLGYFLSPTGRIVTQWNQGLTLFLALALVLPRLVSEERRREIRRS